MRAAVIPFLWLCLLLQPDSAAACKISADSNNNQGLASLIATQALQLQQLSSQVLQQGIQLQQQSCQLEELDSLKKKVTSMESELEWQSASLLALSNTSSKQAAFSVHYKGANIIDVGTGGTLKYNHIVTNVGDGYSPLTGHFTAPHTGIYAFFTSLRSSNDHPYIVLAIFKGEQSLMSVTADGKNDAWDRGTTLVTTHMNEGEIAYVRQTGSSTFLEAGSLTTFSGLLVAAD